MKLRDFKFSIMVNFSGFIGILWINVNSAFICITVIRFGSKVLNSKWIHTWHYFANDISEWLGPFSIWVEISYCFSNNFCRKIHRKCSSQRNSFEIFSISIFFRSELYSNHRKHSSKSNHILFFFFQWSGISLIFPWRKQI